MSQFEPIIDSLKKETYTAKQHLLEYALNTVQNMKRAQRPVDPQDKAALLEYLFLEVDALLPAIRNAASYREKDLLFTCEDLVLGLIMHLCPTKEELSPEIFEKIRILTEEVAKERTLETRLESLFEQETVTEADICGLLDLIRPIEDEYRRGYLYSGLIHFKNDLSKLTDAAKACISVHIAAELERFLRLEALSEDHLDSLELIADISCNFANDKILALLYKILALGHGRINYYIVGTLLTLGKELPEESITALANDLAYAYLTHALLAKHGRQNLFPPECTAPEYLAKSDLTQWLMYPTELGKAPDRIEYIGKIKYLFKKEVFYVFKYRSDSDTLDSDLQNKWLIGWSSTEGGTFSNFDEYALYDKGTAAATLKNIKKNLIG